jgi:guanosine-3',5'-bis(diphosphate) 3'-pyrophosphohydrolase
MIYEHIPSAIEQTAREFALACHGDQKYGNQPYETHLRAVRDVLLRFGHRSPTLLSAAWLHDVLEDTPTTQDQLVNFFGFTIADLVYHVTDEPGASRKERKPATYAKTRRASPEAVLLKLADRIANVEQCLETNDPRFKMYRNEYGDFVMALRTPGFWDKEWERLHHLTFDVTPLEPVTLVTDSYRMNREVAVFRVTEAGDLHLVGCYDSLGECLSIHKITEYTTLRLSEFIRDKVGY